MPVSPPGARLPAPKLLDDAEEALRVEPEIAVVTGLVRPVGKDQQRWLSVRDRLEEVQLVDALEVLRA